MKLLTNMPFESFEDRGRYPDIQVLSYGTAEQFWVDQMQYPPDISYDPVHEHLDELFRRLPSGFVPDAMLIYWPDQQPIPRGLETCPVPVVGVISDYNLSLPWITGLWAWFDTWLCDRNGQQLFENLSFADTRYWCQYSYKAPSHRIYRGIERDLDLGFAGNLSPWVQRERHPWIERILALSDHGLACSVRTGIYGSDYGRFLNRCKIGFNRSIRGEMNLRAFEVPACGAALMMEAENREVRDFLVPDEEVVLYRAEDFEDQVAGLLGNPRRRARIAAAGQQRIRSHSMGHRLRELAALLQSPGPQRLPATEFERQLSRGTAMLGTWARPHAQQVFLECLQAQPDEPRALNGLGCTKAMENTPESVREAWLLFQRAAEIDAGFVPAAFNRWYLGQRSEDPGRWSGTDDLMTRLAVCSSWQALDGLLLPVDFSADSVSLSLALGEALRALDREPYVQAVRNLVGAAEPATV